MRIESLNDGMRFAYSGRSAAFYPAAKRLYDVVFSFIGLLVLSPLFVLVAALIKLSDGGKAFYRQTRVGLHGRPFRIWKFRTMITAAEQAGPAITQEGDSRITRIGRVLRKTKLDEFPQLWNVLKGEMSLVGPRPEVPRYVERYTPEQREILRLKPGITDLASLCFRDEEALLGHATDVEEFYVQHCIPRKLKLNQEYAARASLLSDTWIILQTLCPYWAGVLVAHGILLVAALFLSYGLIYDFAPPPMTAVQFWRELALVLVLQLGCLTWRKQCRGLLSYFSFPELRQVGTALGLATMGLLALWATGVGVPPRNVILLDAFLSFSLLSGFRGMLRLWRESSEDEEDAERGGVVRDQQPQAGVSKLLRLVLHTQPRSAPANPPARVGIIGAGTTGAQLALELVGKKNLGRIPVAFFDDDSQKWQKHIHEIPVVGMPECLLDGWAARLDEVIIAMPDASERRIREIDLLLTRTGLKYYRIASPTSLLLDHRPHDAPFTPAYASQVSIT